MQNINDRKTPEHGRTSKKHFTISKEIANRKKSARNLYSDESKNRMLGSKHSVSSIKSKKKANVSGKKR